MLRLGSYRHYELAPNTQTFNVWIDLTIAYAQQFMKMVDNIQFIPVHGSKSNIRLQNCTIEQSRERKLDLGGFAVSQLFRRERTAEAHGP